MPASSSFSLSFVPSRDDVERGVLARLDASGVTRRARLVGGAFIALGLVLGVIQVVALLTGEDEVPWYLWLCVAVILGVGAAQATMWDRRLRVRRVYRSNPVLFAAPVDAVIDDDGVATSSPGVEGRYAWEAITAVIQCSDLLVLSMGHLESGAQWTVPKRGLADPARWEELVALVRRSVNGTFSTSSR